LTFEDDNLIYLSLSPLGLEREENTERGASLASCWCFVFSFSFLLQAEPLLIPSILLFWSDGAYSIVEDDNQIYLSISPPSGFEKEEKQRNGVRNFAPCFLPSSEPSPLPDA
jgi:hypothetical protein